MANNPNNYTNTDYPYKNKAQVESAEKALGLWTMIVMVLGGCSFITGVLGKVDG